MVKLEKLYATDGTVVSKLDRDSCRLIYQALRCQREENDRMISKLCRHGDLDAQSTRWKLHDENDNIRALMKVIRPYMEEVKQ